MNAHFGKRLGFMLAMLHLAAFAASNCMAQSCSYDRAQYLRDPVSGKLSFSAAFGPYHTDIPMLDADVASFSSLPEPNSVCEWFGKDKRHVYYAGSEIAGADPASFGLIYGSWARDNAHVYLGKQVLESADPASFRVTVREVRDKNYRFKGDTPECKFDEAAPLSLPACLLWK